MVTNNALNNGSNDPFSIGNFFNTQATNASVYATVSSFDNTNPIAINIGNTQGTSAVQSKTAVIFSGGNDTNGFAKIQGSGNVSDGTSGKLEVYVSSASALGLVGTWTTSGMTFSASNTALNNYSEGTWTPTITGGSTAGTTSYSTQTARYRRIGSCVILYFEVTFSSATGTGALTLGGFPFTVANAGSIGAGGYSGGIALTALSTSAAWTGIANTTTAQLTDYGLSHGPNSTQMVASGDLRGTIIYNV